MFLLQNYSHHSFSLLYRLILLVIIAQLGVSSVGAWVPLGRGFRWGVGFAGAWVPFEAWVPFGAWAPLGRRLRWGVGAR